MRRNKIDPIQSNLIQTVPQTPYLHFNMHWTTPTVSSETWPTIYLSYIETLSFHSSSQSQVAFANTSPYSRAETVPFGLFLHSTHTLSQTTLSLFQRDHNLQPTPSSSTHSQVFNISFSHFSLKWVFIFFINFYIFHYFFLYPFNQFINFHKWVIFVLR
jgi:hypothetical protein